jgi:hypothetical protein
MRHSLLRKLVVTALCSVALPCSAQTLSSRPAVFGDPVLSDDPAQGPLVLGRTTLTAALRIFAVELADSVRLPLGHSSNPDTVAVVTAPGESSGWPQPYRRLDLGAGHYTLYFDRHERLIMVSADRSRLPRQVRREDLVARYPTLAVHRHGNVRDEMVAPLAPCLSLTATVWEGDDGVQGPGHLRPGTLLDLGYRYTCQTRPTPVKAGLNRSADSVAR